MKPKLNLKAIDTKKNQEFSDDNNEYIKLVEPPTKDELELAKKIIAEGLEKATENLPINVQETWEEFEQVREQIKRSVSNK